MNNENNVNETEDREYKPKNTKKIVKIIINIILWGVLIGWAGICVYDFINVQSNGKEPKFCIKNETIKYSDGTVKICTGLGYKVINYQRASYKAIEFGPFWISDRTSDNK